MKSIKIICKVKKNKTIEKQLVTVASAYMMRRTIHYLITGRGRGQVHTTSTVQLQLHKFIRNWLEKINLIKRK